MNRKNRYIVYGIGLFVLIIQVVVLAWVFMPVKTGGVSASALIINPAGGVQTDGSDGVRWEFNRAA